MRTSMKDFNLKKSQYSSRIVVSPNTASHRGGSKIVYSRRGNSTDTYRDSKKSEMEIADHEIVNLNSLITQSTKGLNRPSTGGNLASFSTNPSSGNSSYGQSQAK